MRLELKDLQKHYESAWSLPGHLLRITFPESISFPRGHITRYWNPSVGMSALKNPGGVTVEILAFAEEAL